MDNEAMEVIKEYEALEDIVFFYDSNNLSTEEAVDAIMDLGMYRWEAETILEEANV